MSGIYQSDRTDLIVEALVELGKASQTDIEQWILKNKITVELLGKEHSTKESINGWVGVYLHRMRKKGIIEESGVSSSVQKGHKPGKLWKLVDDVCPYCGHQPPTRKRILERL